MPVLRPEDDLPPEVYALARRVAGRLDRGARNHHRASILTERDDIEQACRMAALVLLRKIEPTDQLPLGVSIGTLGAVMRWRAIDWLRSAVEDTHHLGEDAPQLWGGMDERIAALPALDDPFQEVEDRAVIQWAIDTYRGPPWHVECALLVAHGLPLSEAGAAYGISESRASQVCDTFLRTVRGQAQASAA